MMDNFEVETDENGKIICFLDGTILEPRPEEFVRQKYIRILHFEYQYPKKVIKREVSIYYGSKELYVDGKPKRADIAVYENEKAANDKDQGQILFVVECKEPNETGGYNQLVSYVYTTSASGGVWYNGEVTSYYRRVYKPENKLILWTGIPRKNESWDSLGRRKKADLRRPKDIKGLLRRCHNKLHGRGVDGEDDDLTMDMVRIILSKAMDEENTSALPEFYCTPEEYSTEEGQNQVAKRVNALFETVKDQNTDVFSKEERITVGPRAICDVVNELQYFRLLSDLHSSDDWDIMGYAYEQYTASYLKRQKGQFFTNRLVIDMMVQFVDPNYDEVVLDPAGGSGGFLTGIMRHVRKKILTGPGTEISKQRQLDKHRTNLFMVEISKRLVKIAKTAMILNGDGHTGMTKGDSLEAVEKLNETVRARCGINSPKVILTNPPFAGVGEGRISDSKLLENYRTGFRWISKDGVFLPTTEKPSDGVPPELLFFEKCLQWIAPGGRVGIVMPKSFLDTQTYVSLRKIILDEYKLLGVVVCHKNTFQPHTGVRTCIVFVERPLKKGDLKKDYPIYMAMSKKIGQDSEGVTIYKRDDKNDRTDIIDHDLNEIFKDYCLFKQNKLKPSEYRFKINKCDIDEQLRINPQVYLPNLNKSIRQIESIEKIGWTVTTIGQIEEGVQIFKGPRLKSEDLIIEEPIEIEGLEKYYTPSAVLQEKSESVKYLDVKKANKKQQNTINSIRIKHGDIVVSRSGTVGRVSYITKRLHDAIVSDDLIRIRIKNETLRYYIFSFLQSEYAQNQMKINEYGAIQQHLEPVHIKDIIIPVPDNIEEIKKITAGVKNYIDAREKMEALNNEIENVLLSLISGLIE